MRVWDTWHVAQKTVVKPTLKKPSRVSVTTARYSTDGHLIAAGLANGTIQLWDVKGAAPCAASRPSAEKKHPRSRGLRPRDGPLVYFPSRKIFGMLSLIIALHS